MAQQIVRADNYICVQDLSRFYYESKTDSASCEQPPHVPDTRITVKDRLRLDVTVSEGSEIYAWHGETRFSSKSLMEIVGHGPVSSGSFTGYLQNIFIAAGVEFTYRQPTTTDNGSLYNFDFHVPKAVSRYQIKAGNGLVVVPFHGSFTAFADTLQLQSLTVTADGNAIPGNAELCAIQSTVTYQLAHISARDSLIPASFDMIYGSNHSRVVTESRGGYTQCREFSGESTVRFDTGDDTTQDTHADMQAESIRPGLLFRIALATPIDGDTAYAGMPVEGRLAHPAKIGKGVVLPAGTRAFGLLTRFEVRYSPFSQTALMIEFNRLVTSNKTYFFRAIHPNDLYQSIAAAPGRRMGSVRQTGARLPDEDPGVMIFPQTRVHLDEKLVSQYETVETK